MTQIVNAMGWRHYSTANSNYGILANLIGDQLGFHFGTVHLKSTCEFNETKERGDHSILTLRPELAEAMEDVGWT